MGKFTVFLLALLLFCSCTPQQEEAFGTETESMAISETGSAPTTAASRTETTAEIEAAVEKIILKPMPSDKPFDVLECRFDDSFWTKDEGEFPDKEILAFAREICFADEYVQSEIEWYNVSDDLRVVPVENAGGIDFISGGGYDFDNDGEKEFLICLNYKPNWIMGMGGFLIYIDGSKYKILENSMNAGADASVITAGEYTFLMAETGAGAISYFQNIYNFESGMPEKVFDIEGSHSYEYKNDVFYCNIKYDGLVYPFVLCVDGVFRQLGCEEISREDFEAHMKGGKEYLDSLSEKGDEITEIYTYGFYTYQLCGDNFIYEMTEDDGQYIPIRHESENPHKWTVPIEFTEEFLYGEDAHSVRGISYIDFDVGGGYKLYCAEESNDTYTLFAADEKGITDSMSIIREDINDFYYLYGRHPHQNFYDFDVPPGFSVYHEKLGLLYDTYFIIDGKFRQAEWILDGEKLDGIDYTMLYCYGNGSKNGRDEFVSYSADGYDHWDIKEPLTTKRHFTFDLENLRFEGYSEPYPEPTGYAKIADEVMHKYANFDDGLIRAKLGENFESDIFLLKIEEEGFRTTEELMDSLKSFCTDTVAKELYDKYLSGGDFEEHDGCIYRFDGPPADYKSEDYIDSAEEKNGVITAKIYSYVTGQDVPYRINPPMYAEFVQENGVWKISSLPKEK